MPLLLPSVTLRAYTHVGPTLRYGPIHVYGMAHGITTTACVIVGPTGLLPTAARAVGPGPVGLGPQLAASRRAVD